MLYRNVGLSPFSLRREIDRLFEDTFGGGRAASGWQPAVDVREDAKELCLDVELPGISPEQIDITVENGVLTLRGEKRDERREADEDGRYHLVERSYGSFTRSFQLPQGLDDEQIAADFDNGVLRVRIPKAALAQPRRIQIAGAGGARRGAVGEGSSTGAAQGGRGGGRSSTKAGSGGSGGSGGSERERDRMAAHGSETDRGSKDQ